MDNSLLIVDDEPRLTNSFKVLFANRGFDVKTASDGHEALALFRTYPCKVVISDIQMEGLDGIALLDQLKIIDPFVQVIFITGYSSVQSAAEALKQDNAFEYLAKPVKNMETLFETTRSAQKKYDLEKQLADRKFENEQGFAIFRNIFDSMESIVYVADMQTYELIYTNQKFNRVFNNAKPLPPKVKCWQIIQENQTGPCRFCTNKRLLNPDGTPAPAYEWDFQNTRTKRWYAIVDKAIEWYDKRIVRLETALDITEKKEHDKLYRNFEKAVETSKKLESISTLAGGVAHDFNNSLSTIIGNINLAQLSCTDTETQKYLRNAEKGIMQAKGISGKLINFAKGGGPAKVKTDIHSLIRRVLVAQIDTDEVFCSLKADPIPFDFYADQNQLKAAFGNIIQNAIEAMGSVGRIDIRITCETSSLKHPQIIISITDSGCGISKEHLDMVFNPYFTTKPMDSKKSTGLGLSIAWTTISRHGGLLRIESEFQQGTTVHITLPVFRENGQITADVLEINENSELKAARREIRVLIMDDDELVLDVISQLLKRLGYEPFVAENAEQAIQICRSAIKSSNPVCLALLDFEITHHRQGGFYTMSELKKIDPDIKGLLITGHSNKNELQGFEKYGFSGMIKKPFSIKELNRKIRTLF